MTGPQHGKCAILASTLLVAFSLRLGWRINAGSDDFWAHGYSFFYVLSSNIAAGKGLGIDGDGRAMRMPLYPLFLALTTFGGKNYLWIIIPQALMGVGTVLLAYLIGGHLFGRSTGLLASLITALYPYYVVHDTALQETGMFTLLTALSVFLLLRARGSMSITHWTLTGVALGAAVLTRQTLAPFSIGVLVWIGICGKGSRRQKLFRCTAIFVPFALLVGSWVARNYLVVGAPILTSEFGRQLWNANNEKTFSVYPTESIDRSTDQAFSALTPADRRELDGLSGNEIGESNWYLRKGIDYIKAHPAATLVGAVRKVAAGFSWRFNPVREPLVQAVYLASYLPISILGVLGMLMTWRQWREHMLIYLVFVTFAMVTAVFWAHTSHRSYLDIYWIVFAAYTLTRLFGQGARRQTTHAYLLETAAQRSTISLS